MARKKQLALARPPQRLDSPLSVVLEGTDVSKLEKLGVTTTEQLLRYYPRRYIDTTELTPLDTFEDPARDEEMENVVLVARIRRADTIRMRKGRGSFLKVTAEDSSGRTLTMSFFNQSAWSAKRFAPGATGIFVGKIERHPKYGLQLAHPDWHPFGDRAIDLERMLAVYPERGGTSSWHLGGVISEILDALDGWSDVPDPLPSGVRERTGLMDLRDALNAIHRPRSADDHRAARKRFVYEEAFVLQAELARRRASVAALEAKPRVPSFGGLVEALDARLPFELTDGQKAVGERILDEMARPHPMQRLLQGEVGSGKTVVALRAMLAVVDAGGQAALLAPTEVLAQQHYRTIVDMMGPLAESGMLGGSDIATKVTLLTGSQSTATRRAAMLEAASGEAGIVVGTHALLEDKVQFADLGLVVVDEQHRFGVEQRAALTAKHSGLPPHVLVMTATPIPRTVAMTVFGDLEVSTLTERPFGRAPVQSTVVPLTEKASWWERIWSRVREEIEKGHQAYVVAPRIAPDDTVEPEVPDDDEESAGEPRPPARTVLETVEELSTGDLKGLRIAALHGRMPGQEKDAVMQRFAAGEIDVLVSTTVIEVGVDVKNASMMVILDADWFGVSQLHQLRGRIGRGDVPALCLLVTTAPPETPARERLDAVAATNDGFELSRVDLEQRREGDILGSAQHGYRSTLRLLRVIRDEKVIERARGEADAVIAGDPELAAHPELRRAVDTLYGEERAEFLEKS